MIQKLKINVQDEIKMCANSSAFASWDSIFGRWGYGVLGGRGEYSKDETNCLCKGYGLQSINGSKRETARGKGPREFLG